MILADEPTGALDKASGEEVMRILEQLNAQGQTIILVTHDAAVAAHAHRNIEISDGEIISDRRTAASDRGALQSEPPSGSAAWRAAAARFNEALRMALAAMSAHRTRTVLTMLGIIIGISSVVSVVGLGKGAQNRVMAEISELGTNTIEIYPGKDFGDPRASTIQTLTNADAHALAREPYVDSVTPTVSRTVTARRRNVAATSTVIGVGVSFFRVRGLKASAGRLFDAQAPRATSQVAVLDAKASTALFPRGESPLGKIVILDTTPIRVIGVLKPPPRGSFGATPTIYVPYSTAAARLVGKSYLESITVRVKDGVSTQAAQAAVTQFLTRRHGGKDFFVFNSDQIRKAIASASQTLALLISAIAAISLLVGGIGVMNIMLVSVTERTREIGVRMAVGARQSDILQQFLIEAVLVCLIGGAIGTALALLLGPLVSLAAGFEMVVSPVAIVLAFACSTGIGVLFGFLPARNAARLHPVDALASD